MTMLILLACRPSEPVEPGPTGPEDSGAPTTSEPPGSTADTATVHVASFSEDIAPLFAALCNDCHHPESAIGYDLTNPFDPETGIVNRPNSWVVNGSLQTVIVDPGNPDNSFLITKIEETELDSHVDGNPMPRLQPLFDAAELDAVEQWIADGAADDAWFQDEVAPLFGTEVTLGSRSGRCTWCHYPGSPTGMSVIDVFDPVEGMVGRDSGFGGQIVAPGDPDGSVLMEKLRGGTAGSQMPLQHRRVTAEEVTRVREWILLGALQD